MKPLNEWCKTCEHHTIDGTPRYGWFCFVSCLWKHFENTPTDKPHQWKQTIKKE